MNKKEKDISTKPIILAFILTPIISLIIGTILIIIGVHIEEIIKQYRNIGSLIAVITIALGIIILIFQNIYYKQREKK